MLNNGAMTEIQPNTFVLLLLWISNDLDLCGKMRTGLCHVDCYLFTYLCLGLNVNVSLCATLWAYTFLPVAHLPSGMLVKSKPNGRQ